MVCLLFHVIAYAPYGFIWLHVNSYACLWYPHALSGWRTEDGPPLLTVDHLDDDAPGLLPGSGTCADQWQLHFRGARISCAWKTSVWNLKLLCVHVACPLFDRTVFMELVRSLFHLRYLLGFHVVFLYMS